MALILRAFLGAISLFLFFMPLAAGQVITEVNIGDKVVVVSETEKMLKGAPNSDVLVTYSIEDGKDAKYFVVSGMVNKATANTGELRQGDGTYSLIVTGNGVGTVTLKLLGKLKDTENDLYLYEESSSGLVLLSHIRFVTEDIYPSQFTDADKLLLEAKAKGFSGDYSEIMLNNARLEWRAGDKQNAIKTVTDIMAQVSDYLKEYSVVSGEISQLWKDAQDSGKVSDVSVFLKEAEENAGRGEFERARTEIAKAREITQPSFSGRIIGLAEDFKWHIATAVLVLGGWMLATRRNPNKERRI